MIMLNKRFKTPVPKIFPRFIVCRRLRTQSRCRKLLRLCWPLQLSFTIGYQFFHSLFSRQMSAKTDKGNLKKARTNVLQSEKGAPFRRNIPL